MLSWRPSGLIVAGLEHTEAARTMMRAAGIPIVEVMDTDGEPVAASVGISHVAAGRLMAREIAARGYRNICYLGAATRAIIGPVSGSKGSRRGLRKPAPRSSIRCCIRAGPGSAPDAK